MEKIEEEEDEEEEEFRPRSKRGTNRRWRKKEKRGVRIVHCLLQYRVFFDLKPKAKNYGSWISQEFVKTSTVAMEPNP